MKKVIAVILTVVLFTSALLVLSSCGGTESYDFSDNSDGTITITKYTGSNKATISIPSEIDGKTVTGIDAYAFYNLSKLKNISIPDTVTYMADTAICDCDKIEANTYENIRYLGNENNPYLMVYKNAGSEMTGAVIHENARFMTLFAFSNCVALETISIPDGMTMISQYAFYQCRSLKEVKIPDSVKVINFDAFAGCSELQKVTMGKGIINVEKDAFNYCLKLNSVEFHDGLKTIGANAFANCSSLSSVSIPDSIVSVGSNAFGNCDSLVYKLDNDLVYLGNSSNPYVLCDGAYYYDITHASVNENTKVIGGYAFGNCSDLTSVDIPEGVITIGNEAFLSCTVLQSIKIPVSVTVIGDKAFSGCGDLKDILYAGSEEQWNQVTIGNDTGVNVNNRLKYNSGN